jgi:hypothetical protein
VADEAYQLRRTGVELRGYAAETSVNFFGHSAVAGWSMLDKAGVVRDSAL